MIVSDALRRDALAAALPAYEIGEELGRGAYGIVVGATHRRLDRPVAVKVLTLDPGDDDAAERFLAEARVLAGLDHPHVVRIYDYVERDGSCLLVMEHLGGGTLLQHMRTGRLTLPAAGALIVASCLGLDHAHGCGVLHRDIKPENLMFAADGVLKVTDFGIAHVMGSTAATKTGVLTGTPAYIAPEQALGDALTAATDVYAVGTVLYELLAGRLPFDPADSPLATIYQHVHADPRPVLEVAADLPEPVAAVVDRAVRREPDERPADARTFAAELVQAGGEAWGGLWEVELARRLRVPRPEGERPRSTLSVRAVGRETVAAGAVGPPRWQRRRRTLALGAAGAAAAAAAGVVALTAGGEPPSDRPAATAGPAAEGVVRRWLTAFNAGDNARAARSFAPGAVAADQVLRTRADAVAFNSYYGCGYGQPSLRTDTRTGDVFVSARFIRRKVDGGGCRKPDLGSAVNLRVRVAKGRITRWEFA